MKAIFANGNSTVCNLNVHSVAAFHGSNIYKLAATLVYNSSDSGNCLHNCSGAVGGFRVGKFNCAMYHKYIRAMQ